MSTVVQEATQQRKFINPTGGYVGANIIGGDGKPTAVAVEPGGEVWLTPAEERMTAEAPRLAQDNPFVKEWEEPVEWTSDGEILRTVTRRGTLVLADEPARPLASARYIPPAAEATQPGPTSTEEPPVDKTANPGEHAAPEPPPVMGRAAPGEVVGTPEATAANREALASRQAPPAPRRPPEPTVTAEDKAKPEEKPPTA